MPTIESATACPRESLWPELLSQIPALADPGLQLSDADVRVSRRYGVYRDVQSAKHFMLRIKVLEATLTAGQLWALSELATRYGRNLMDLTTRQCVQLHWLPAVALPAVFASLAAAELTTKGAGGGTVLNITGCPAAGLDAHELFDCRPQWHELVAYFQRETRYLALPHKLKMTISTCDGQCSAPETNCIAFVGSRRKQSDGSEQVGFDLCVGGGLGSSPRAAQSLGVFLMPEEVIAAARAVIDLWRDNPDNHRVKGKSRLKWLVERTGIGGIREAVEQRLGRHLANIEGPSRTSNAVVDHLGIHRQRSGEYYLGFPVLAGTITGEQAMRIADIAAAAGGDVRLTRLQNLILANIPSAQVRATVTSMTEQGFALEGLGLRGRSVACSGQPYCRFAQASTKPMLQTLVERLEQRFGHLANGISLSIDGCPHACASHWTADIGLQGTQTRNEQDTRIEAYDVFIRKSIDDEGSVFGHAIVRKVAAGQTLEYVERLVGTYLACQQENESFSQYVGRLSDSALMHIATGGVPTQSGVASPALLPQL
jgi:sulfite reductase beta subunit-like hemoprotein